MRTGGKIPLPMTLALITGAIVLGLVTVSIGAGLVGDLAGGLSSALGGAMAKLSSQAPATVAPSGVALDTPVISAPDNGGYTSQTSTSIQGTVPGGAVGKTGYTVVVYRIGTDGARQQVARVAVGGTTQFITPPIALTEGNNVLVATLDSPTGEGQPSPEITYILKTSPPALKVTSPASNAQVSASSVDVAGVTDPGATVLIRNEQAPGGAVTNSTADSDGRFKLAVQIVAGPNTIDLTATDKAGNSTSSSMTINRNYGQLSPHLSVSPSKFSSSAPVAVTLAVHATSANGGPLANAKVTFILTIYALGPIQSGELTTDANGTATWVVNVSGGAPGPGQASVIVTSPAGDVVTGTATITTT
jgi:hypothetical protein